MGPEKAPFRANTHRSCRDLPYQRGLPLLFRDFCDAAAAKHAQAWETCFAPANRLGRE